MDHLQPFCSRPVQALSPFEANGWTLKRYAIIAQGRAFDPNVAKSASAEAIRRLPCAGDLSDAVGNHGTGIQIIHFAQDAVVSPVFYWRWGCVLAHIDQMRASWDTPTAFGDGVKDIVGCLWEMDIVRFEMDTWRSVVLDPEYPPHDRLATYHKMLAA